MYLPQSVDQRPHAVPAPTLPIEVWAQRSGSYHRLLSHEIDWIEAERDYLHLHSAGRSFLVRAPLTALHERLGARDFLRVRRSAVVRLNAMKQIARCGPRDLEVELLSGARIRVGRTYLPDIRRRMRFRAPGPIIA